ncbi:MAG TPA: response regulator transcription factor [Sediminibacterium sp.]|nr:response regulator transcription factor [Sediminibacterium sp.]
MKDIAIVDDHALMRASLRQLIHAEDAFRVVFEAANGRELLAYLQQNPPPDIVLLDISMPEMDGFETARFLSAHYPDIRILVISMLRQAGDIQRLVQWGICGYLPKDAEPAELLQALHHIHTLGYHDNQWFHPRMRKNRQIPFSGSFSNQEKCFIRLACTELTYKQIAHEMKVSPRTVDSYRDGVFRKLQVCSRIGVVVYAIRHHFISLWEKPG